MDHVRDPYAPGAGTSPPELAGRADLLEVGTTAIKRIVAGRPVRSLIMVGPSWSREDGLAQQICRGAGEDIATANGCRASLVEAHEGKTLPELLAPQLRSILHQLSLLEGSKDLARRGLRGLKGFLNGLKVTINDVDFAISMDAEGGLADSGNIEADLPDLIVAVGEAARAANRPIALIIDELQYLLEVEFSALIMSTHKTNQKSLPVLMIGAGLPQIRGLAGNSKSYSERLFTFPDIGALNREDAVSALQKPANEESASFSTGAIDKILSMTEMYPYFLQQWAYEAWNIAKDPLISEDDITNANGHAIRELDRSFFKVRFDRCNPSEKRYMRALADFGSGKQRSGDIAEILGVKASSVAPTRSALIKKGMIYSPAHGDTEFTVPLFDQYMMRAIPVLEPIRDED